MSQGVPGLKVNVRILASWGGIRQKNGSSGFHFTKISGCCIENRLTDGNRGQGKGRSGAWHFKNMSRNSLILFPLRGGMVPSPEPGCLV